MKLRQKKLNDLSKVMAELGFELRQCATKSEIFISIPHFKTPILSEIKQTSFKESKISVCFRH